MVYMAEILVTLSVLREPARIFLNKMCSFDVTDFEKTLLVTLYNICGVPSIKYGTISLNVNAKRIMKVAGNQIRTSEADG